MPPHFSIIIPFYNGMPYLKACMESVLQQTYSNFTIWLLDSGSTDGSLEYVQQLQDERIKIITTPKRLSITENWNQILSLPLAPYATILGQDDVLYAEFLHRMDLLIRKHPVAGLYTSPFGFIDKDGNIIRLSKSMQPKYQQTELLTSMLSLELDITATGYIFNSALYKQVGGIPLYPNLLYSDYALWLMLVQHGYLAVDNKPLFAFRLHNNTSQITEWKVYLKALTRFTDYLKVLAENDNAIRRVVAAFSQPFITRYGEMMVMRLLATPDTLREGMSVKKLVNELNGLLDQLGCEIPEGVCSHKHIQWALYADRVLPVRWAYSLFRRIRYGKR
jgi:glycosyltransferase involved in cell wall biosynthesis